MIRQLLRSLVVLVDPNAGDDTIDSDAVDNNDGTATTGTISLAVGETSIDNDAGLEQPNQDPTAGDDEAMTCADETTVINLLDGDDDPDGDTLSVFEIVDTSDNETAGVGETITLDSGAMVTLLANGTVTYDGTVGHADLPLGSMAIDEFDYVLVDGQGGSDVGSVDVTVKGALNTKETISASLPVSGSAEISFPAPFANQTYQVTVTDLVLNEGEANEIDLSGHVFDGFCIDIVGALEFETELTGDWYSSTDATDLADLEADGLVGNSDKLDEVNWILNNTEELYNDGYNFFQVQDAIWLLTDGYNNAVGLDEFAAQEIADLAMDNDGYMPEEGGLFGVVFAPTDISQTDGERGQTFIVAVPWEDLESDCIC